ncbi:MAG TPA: STAS domain-containing protein [Mycobacteriales bacterium]|nr:STAS domain-containing protein [Mycobacteriales bacterium]
MPTDSARPAHVVVTGEHARVTLHGELDVMHRDALSCVLDEARRAAKRVCVDLADVQFLDWIALSLILQMASLHRRAGGTVVVTGATTSTRRLVGLMGAEALLGTSLN